MQLSDFFFKDKAEVGTRMPIMLPDGTDSGEWLNIIDPEADAAVKASRAFVFAYRAATAELEPLRKKCEASGDFAEYNISVADAALELNRALACELVNAWSFTEPFNRENLQKLLEQYGALANQVADAHAARRKELEAK